MPPPRAPHVPITSELANAAETAAIIEQAGYALTWKAVQTRTGIEDHARDRELIDLKAQFQAMFEQTGVGMAYGTLDGKILRVNQHFASMLGYTPAEMVGRPFNDFVRRSDVKATDAAVRQLRGEESGAHISLEKCYVRRDGTYLWALTTLTVAKSPEGEPYIIGVVQDITPRKIAEDARRRSELQYRQLLEHSADGIMLVSPDLRVIDTNSAMCRMVGGVREDIIGKPLGDFLFPAGLQAAPVRLPELLMGRSVEFAPRMRRFDGTRFDAQVSTNLLPDGRIEAIVRDVTETRRAEEKFRRVFDSNIVGVHFWRSDGTIADANDAFLQIVGISREEFQRGTFNWKTATSSEYAGTVAAKLQEVRETGSCTPFEKDYIRPDGERVRVLVAGAMIGTAEEGVAITLDISEREKANAALRESEARFRAMIENSYDAISILDAAGTVEYESPSIERLLGYKPGELVGTNAFSRIHPDDVPLIREKFLGSLREGKTTAKAEFRYKAKDGSWRHLETVGSKPLGGAVDGIIINSRDITERRAYEKSLAQAERLSGLGRLAATVAHEFNNVLMGIQPFVEVIRRKTASDPALTKACTHIETSVQRGRRITQEILRFTRPVDPSFACVPVNEWLNEMAAEMKGVLADRHQLVIAPVDSELAISGDRLMLTQAIMNLVVNARDAMTISGTITIEATARGANEVAITVRDTGSGIPEEDRERIFEPLYTTKRGGTGLGLPLTHQIITRHGGLITLETEIGRGTTFHLFLPRHREAVASEIAKESTASPKSCRVLIVEDEGAVAEGIEATLQGANFATHIVSSGQEAAAVMPHFSPDVVLLDVGLPDIDGFEVYRALSSRFADVAFIFSTGDADTSRFDAIANSRCRLIQKPYESALLIGTIGEVMQPATVRRMT